MLKRLKLMSEQRLHGGFVFRPQLVQAEVDGGSEFVVAGVILGLQTFLLDEVFRDLVLAASERLWNLTEVYRLEWRDSTFYVVDHDNARQRRSADTLSGGETFLASLALALGVKRAGPASLRRGPSRQPLHR